jgi:hypothetical protein
MNERPPTPPPDDLPPVVPGQPLAQQPVAEVSQEQTAPRGAKIINFLERKERRHAAALPYASYDELPSVTMMGQELVRQIVDSSKHRD